MGRKSDARITVRGPVQAMKEIQGIAKLALDREFATSKDLVHHVTTEISRLLTIADNKAQKEIADVLDDINDDALETEGQMRVIEFLAEAKRIKGMVETIMRGYLEDQKQDI